MDEVTHKICKSCNEEKSITAFGKYIDPRNGKEKIRNECNSCRVKREVKRNRDNDYVNHKKNNKKYYQNNKEKKKKHTREYKAKKRQEDMQFLLRTKLSGRIIRWLDGCKSKTTQELTGCTFHQFKKWIEFQFTDDINWDNRSEWHLDHVIPLSFFNVASVEEQYLACHWTNLRPLYAVENKSKGGKILQDVILDHIHTIKSFLNENIGYQTNIEKCWWQRIDLWYGKNPYDDKDDFKDLLKRIIRSEDWVHENDSIPFND